MADFPPVDVEPEPGDTVIELRNGVPYIGTEPGAATAASWDVTDELTIDPRDVQPGDTVIQMPNGVLWWQPGAA